MRQMVITVSGLCMTAAVCSQLIQRNRFGKAVQLLLGFEIARVILELAEKLLKCIGKWS